MKLGQTELDAPPLHHQAALIELASLASSVMRFQSLLATTSAGVNQVPPQTTTFGSDRNCGAFSTVTPPVGQNLTSPNGPANPLRRFTPPTATAGNNFRK